MERLLFSLIRLLTRLARVSLTWRWFEQGMRRVQVYCASGSVKIKIRCAARQQQIEAKRIRQRLKQKKCFKVDKTQNHDQENFVRSTTISVYWR